MTDNRVQHLVDRLKKARCWRDENSYGMRSTKWLHLIPYDVDMAIDILQEKLNEDYRAEKSNAG